MANLRGMISVILLLSLGLHAYSAQQAATSIDWKALDDAWKKYTEAPSDGGLEQILVLLPTQGKVWDNASAGAPIIDAMVQGLGILEGQIYEKNPKAVRVGFRLFTISYGSFEERLARILGNLIGFDCILFLQELQLHQGILPSLELLLASYRFSGSTPEEMETERKYRIKMLESINDKALKDIRNECLKILRKLKS